MNKKVDDKNPPKETKAKEVEKNSNPKFKKKKV